jgi:hypothetical protein
MIVHMNAQSKDYRAQPPPQPLAHCNMKVPGLVDSSNCLLSSAGLVACLPCLREAELTQVTCGVWPCACVAHAAAVVANQLHVASKVVPGIFALCSCAALVCCSCTPYSDAHFYGRMHINLSLVTMSTQ